MPQPYASEDFDAFERALGSFYRLSIVGDEICVSVADDTGVEVARGATFECLHKLLLQRVPRMPEKEREAFRQYLRRRIEREERTLQDFDRGSFDAAADQSRYALVVDDDVMQVMLAVEILHDIGYSTFSAINRDQAFEYLMARGAEISVLITDAQMPGHQDGLALAREVAVRWPRIHILVVSGMQHLLRSDLPDSAVFVRKPITPTIIKSRLRDLLPDDQKPRKLR